MSSKWVTVDPLQIPEDCSPHQEHLPSLPACYAIYCDGQLVYIGQTMNLRHRFRGHEINYARYCNQIVTPWGRCLKLLIKYRVPQCYGEWAMTELRLIKRLQPVFNCVGSVKKRKARAA